MTPLRALAAAAVARRILVVNGCILNLLQISMFEDMSASNIMERLSFPVKLGRVFNLMTVIVSTLLAVTIIGSYWQLIADIVQLITIICSYWQLQLLVVTGN